MLSLIVAGEAVDTGFNEDKAELRVFVLAVGLEVFADRNSLFDQVPEVFRDLWGKA